MGHFPFSKNRETARCYQKAIRRLNLDRNSLYACSVPLIQLITLKRQYYQQIRKPLPSLSRLKSQPNSCFHSDDYTRSPALYMMLPPLTSLSVEKKASAQPSAFFSFYFPSVLSVRADGETLHPALFPRVSIDRIRVRPTELASRRGKRASV